MAPKTRAKSAKAGAKHPNPKQTIKSKLHIHKRENDSKNTKRCRHCEASVRSEETETALQDTANAAANVSAAPLDSIELVDPRESAVLPDWNGRRRRSGLRTRDELEVADFLVTEDFRRKWASRSAAATMVQMKKDLNYFTPVQKGIPSKARPDSTGPSFIGT